MLLGQAYSDILTPDEQQALQFSSDILIDSIFEDLRHVEKTKDAADTMICIYLPEHYLYKYTPRFLRKFAVCLITVVWKLAQSEHQMLSSLAEELAAWVLIKEARRHLEDDTDKEVEDAFGAFEDVYFEDTDFKYLYDNSDDGIDETQLARSMGISSLAFDDWFLPFSDEPSRTPHPFVLDDNSPKS